MGYNQSALEKNMKYLTICLLLLFLPTVNSSAEETNGLMVTAQAITNILSQADQCSTIDGVDAYSKLLADDLVVTFAISSEPGKGVEVYNKDEYLAQLRQSLAALPVAAGHTTIQKIMITPDGQMAGVQSISSQRSVANEDGEVMEITVSENSIFRIRDGKIKVTRLAGKVISMSVNKTSPKK